MVATLYSQLDSFLYSVTKEHNKPVLENLPWLWGVEQFRLMLYFLEEEFFHRPKLMYDIQENQSQSDIKLLFFNDFSWVSYTPLNKDEAFELASKNGIDYCEETMSKIADRPGFSTFNFLYPFMYNLRWASNSFSPLEGSGFPYAFDDFFRFFGISDSYQDWLDANPNYKPGSSPRGKQARLDKGIHQVSKQQLHLKFFAGFQSLFLNLHLS